MCVWQNIDKYEETKKKRKERRIENGEKRGNDYNLKLCKVNLLGNSFSVFLIKSVFRIVFCIFLIFFWLLKKINLSVRLNIASKSIRKIFANGKSGSDFHVCRISPLFCKFSFSAALFLSLYERREKSSPFLSHSCVFFSTPTLKKRVFQLDEGVFNKNFPSSLANPAPTPPPGKSPCVTC